MTNSYTRCLTPWLVVMLGWVIPSPAYTQSLNPPWLPVASNTEGALFSYHPETVRFFNMPPTLISLNILSTDKTGKASSNYNRAEITCSPRQYKQDNSSFLSVESEVSTVRRVIVDSLCGFPMFGGYWIAMSMNLVQRFPAAYSYHWLFDVASLTKTDFPFPGVAVRVATANYNSGQSPPFSLHPGFFKTVFSCENPKRYSFTQRDKEEFAPAVQPAIDSHAMGWITLLCSGQFPISERPSKPPTDSINQIPEPKPLTALDDSKRVCGELGFKAGTEKFGECVLKLSR